MNAAKNDALHIAKKLEMNMTEENIKEGLERINIRCIIDEKKSKEKEENSDIIDKQNEDIGSAEDFEEDFEDFENIQNDISIFKNETELNLKDYTTDCKKNEGLFLEVNVNGKKYVVRKSSLCWLYQDKNRLSSDRLYRVRDMNIVSSKEKLSKELKIESEKYYCVYYDTGWFIGRVLHDNIEQNTCKIKFLCANLNEFRWPKKDDVQEIDKKFIMYGPISLNGTNPFTIDKEVRAKIQKKYKNFKND